jgi:hypothetical protein
MAERTRNLLAPLRLCMFLIALFALKLVQQFWMELHSSTELVYITRCAVTAEGNHIIDVESHNCRDLTAG